MTETSYRDGAVLAHHCHDNAYVSIVLEGDYTEVRAETPQRCSAGTVIVHHCGEEHADYFPRSGRCLNIEVLDTAHAAHAALNTGAANGAGSSLYYAGRQLARVHASTGGDDVALAAAIHTFLTVVAAENNRPSTTQPAWLRSALDDSSWNDALPLERIAAAAGVHPVHFSRTFRTYMGLTPAQYRRSSRVRAASKLLLDSHAELADVALLTGFHDQSHFTHAFAAVAGMTPARYRTTFRR